MEESQTVFLVGASVASGFAPMVSGIPYVGWLASGWLVMLGSDLGSSVGSLPQQSTDVSLNKTKIHYG